MSSALAAAGVDFAGGVSEGLALAVAEAARTGAALATGALAVALAVAVALEEVAVLGAEAEGRALGITEPEGAPLGPMIAWARAPVATKTVPRVNAPNGERSARARGLIRRPLLAR
jgi:hypothetical protein